MKKALFVFCLSGLLGSSAAISQELRKDKAVFVEPRNEFWDSIKTEVARFEKKDQPKRKVFQMDFGTVQAPLKVTDFTQYWHNKPVSQAISGMCWCFSATSYFESEIYRQTQREIKLSELYTVYWEYVEKATRYLNERGNSAFGEGSEANAVPRIWKKYGIVPADAYSGRLPGQVFHNHQALFHEMESFLSSVKSNNAWNVEGDVETIKSILNHYLGEPPSSVTVHGRQMTPKEYCEKIVKLNLDDYVDVMSLMEKPYFQMVEYEVPDNWWHSREYWNVPLDEFVACVKTAVRNGFTICIGGDVSEPGYEGHAGIAVVPTFDIPAGYIDEYARQMRFSNGTTGDDHGIHIVGYTQKDGQDWYLVKDSGAGSRNNSHPGYYFYREDYVELKMLSLMVHKDAVRSLLKQRIP